MALLLLALALLPQGDPAEQIRRLELRSRLEELIEQGRPEPVAKAVLKALRGRPDPWDVEVCMAAAGDARLGKPVDFIVAWDKVAALEPRSPALALFRASLEKRAERPADYRRRLEAAAKDFPGDVPILRQLGEARRDDGEDAAAAAAWEECLRLQRGPGPTPLHLLLARCYARTGAPAAAVEHLRAAEKWESQETLGDAAGSMGLHSEAVRFYREAFREDSERTYLRLKAAHELRAAGRSPEAVAELRALMQGDKEEVAAVAWEYFVLLPRKAPALAVAAALRDLVHAPPDVATALDAFERIQHSVLEERRGEIIAAWEMYEPEPVRVIVLSRLWDRWERKPDLALKVLAEGETRFPDAPWIPYERGRLLESLKRREEMGVAYERAADLDPEGIRIGAPPLHCLEKALKGHVHGKNRVGAFRVGLRLLADARVAPALRTEARTALAASCAELGDRLWDELRKVKLPPPGPDVVLAVRRGLEKLGSDDYDTRVEGGRTLRKLGVVAVPPLLEKIDVDDVDLRSRIREILVSLLSE